MIENACYKSTLKIMIVCSVSERPRSTGLYRGCEDINKCEQDILIFNTGLGDLGNHITTIE